MGHELGTMRRCSGCRSVLARPDAPFGPVFSTAEWTDGRGEDSLRPHGYQVIRCPRCEAVRWTEALEPVEGTAELVLPFIEPRLQDYQALLADTTQPRSRLLYLRRRAWWLGNDRRRGPWESPLSLEERENLTALFELLDASDEAERLEKVELARELGRFPEARELLRHGFRPDLAERAGLLARLVRAGDVRVHRLEPPMPPPESAPSPAPWSAALVGAVKAHAYMGVEFSELWARAEQVRAVAAQDEHGELPTSLEWLLQASLRGAVAELAGVGREAPPLDRVQASVVRVLVAARQQLDLGASEPAESAYKRALGRVIRLAPSSYLGTHALGGLAEVYRRRGDLIRARRELETAVRQPAGERDALLWLRLGQVALAQDDRMSARFALGRASSSVGESLLLDEPEGLIALVPKEEVAR